MHGDGHPLVMVVNAADELGQVRLDVTQRKHCHSQKYDQKSTDRQTALSLSSLSVSGKSDLSACIAPAPTPAVHRRAVLVDQDVRDVLQSAEVPFLLSARSSHRAIAASGEARAPSRPVEVPQQRYLRLVVGCSATPPRYASALSRVLAGLSLVPGHRRGHGAAYDAVNAGAVDVTRLRWAVGSVPVQAWPDGRVRLAADVCNWLRPEARTSPERMFCHVHGRGKNAGQMIPGVAVLGRGRASSSRSQVVMAVCCGGNCLTCCSRPSTPAGVWAWSSRLSLSWSLTTKLLCRSGAPRTIGLGTGLSCLANQRVAD